MSDSTHVRRAGLLSALAGVVFVPYALSKGWLTAVIVTERWGLFGLSPEASAQLFHVFEAVPLGGMMVGLVALRVRIGARRGFAGLGVWVALAGFGLTVLAHTGEHLLAPWTVTWLTGEANWFLWGYYGGWLVLYAGVALYGVSLLEVGGVPDWLAWLFVAAFPAVVLLGLAVVALGAFTAAGTFRLVQGSVWTVVGYWLWMAESAWPSDAGEPVAAPRSDET